MHLVGFYITLPSIAVGYVCYMLDALCLSRLYQVIVCGIFVKSLGLSLPYEVTSCELCSGMCYVYGNKLACVWGVSACLVQPAALILFTTDTQFVSTLRSSTLFYLLEALRLSLPYTAAPSFIRGTPFFLCLTQQHPLLLEALCLSLPYTAAPSVIY